jgi:hypothetical protein
MKERPSGKDINDLPRFMIRATRQDYFVAFTIHDQSEYGFRGDEMFVVWEDEPLVAGRVKDDDCVDYDAERAHFCDRETAEAFAKALLDAYDFGKELLGEVKP